ncbi:MAG: hypothetical protein HY965_07670 [Ignavibacteriales bacterium]|nr:hypothetical protein [Ignavibacteriales bacterium]
MKKVFLALLFFPAFLFSQEAYHGKGVMSNSGYVEYFKGNIPVVISVPHDGESAPSAIPDRNCGGAQTKSDIHTLEMGLGLRKAFFNKTGNMPYLIINHLKRRKVDVNREVEEAACGSRVAEIVWDEYHSFIDSAKEAVFNQFKKGLYIDLHAHGHTAQFLEIGYLLDAEELQLSNNDLDDALFIEKSSIRSLTSSGLSKEKFTSIVRGSQSLGTLIENAGYPAIPSLAHPYPELEQPFFRGGYSLHRHGSLNGGTIDGVQIETNFKNVRDNSGNITAFSQALTDALIQFVNHHYGFRLSKSQSEFGQ